MNTRIARDKSQVLTQQVAGLRADVDGLKVNQRVGGSAMVTWISSTTGVWDEEVNFATAGSLTFAFTFTAFTQDYPLGRLMYRVYSGTTTNEIYPWTSNWPHVALYPDYSDTSNPKVLRWNITLFNDGGSQTYYVKFWVLTSDNGTIP